MEIRLALWEILIVTGGFLFMGILAGFMMTNNFEVSTGILYLMGMVLPVLTLIVRKRFRLGS